MKKFEFLDRIWVGRLCGLDVWKHVDHFETKKVFRCLKIIHFLEEKNEYKYFTVIKSLTVPLTLFMFILLFFAGLAYCPLSGPPTPV